MCNVSIVVCTCVFVRDGVDQLPIHDDSKVYPLVTMAQVLCGVLDLLCVYLHKSLLK